MPIRIRHHTYPYWLWDRPNGQALRSLFVRENISTDEWHQMQASGQYIKIPDWLDPYCRLLKWLSYQHFLSMRLVVEKVIDRMLLQQFGPTGNPKYIHNWFFQLLMVEMFDHEDSPFGMSLSDRIISLHIWEMEHDRENYHMKYVANDYKIAVDRIPSILHRVVDGEY